MADYIDGFVHPIPRNRLRQYLKLSQAVAEIWREHGALDYREFVGDDMSLAGTRSFSEMVASDEDEVVLFGWVVFDSKKTRDLANARVAKDPRVPELMSRWQTGFDAERMAYGGFQSL